MNEFINIDRCYEFKAHKITNSKHRCKHETMWHICSTGVKIYIWFVISKQGKHIVESHALKWTSTFVCSLLMKFLWTMKRQRKDPHKEGGSSSTVTFFSNHQTKPLRLVCWMYYCVYCWTQPVWKVVIFVCINITRFVNLVGDLKSKLPSSMEKFPNEVLVNYVVNILHHSSYIIFDLIGY